MHTPIISSEVSSAAHNMLGLGTLLDEMASQGIAVAALLQGTGLAPAQLADPMARMTTGQKITIFRNVHRLSALPDVGLRAGSRQRLSDFGMYGYALVSSATFGDAVVTGIKHIQLAGPVLAKRFHIDGQHAILEGRDALDLGEVLPLATEFWFSSMLKLATTILEAPLPNLLLRLPYPAPAHAAAYRRLFACPVEFGCNVMEWHFDAAVLRQPCPNANPITADLCRQFCTRMLQDLPAEHDLLRHIRTVCLSNKGACTSALELAQRLGMSLRTLQCRLAEHGKNYQSIVDEVRLSQAEGFLRETSMSVGEIAERLGFSEAASFRRAFRKWTGQSPHQFRAGH